MPPQIARVLEEIAMPDDTDRSGRDEIVQLIAAVAAGDASREDVVASLRNQGVDSLDVLIEVLASATRNASNTQGRRHVDVQRMSNATDPRRASEIVHQTPSLPFLLRGTLYDPADIARFHGQELHFISSARADEMIVIDDRELMQQWWQLSYLSLNAGSDAIYLSPRGGDIVVSPPGGDPGAPEGFGYPGGGAPVPPVPHTNFYEDVNFDGSRLELKPNLGYWDLTEVSMGFLGLGSDWNDKISSVQFVSTQVAVLHDDVNMSGSSLTLTFNRANLFEFGFNDRASSVETW
jgi:hypothetical protein